jgi:hypothetical protein
VANSPEEELIKKQLLKEAKQRERANILVSEINEGKDKTILNKVGLILNKYPHTRNSDVSLLLKYWEVFEGHKKDSVEKKEMYMFERLTSIARARAKIQNEYGLYPSDKKIRGYRKNKEEKEKEFQIENKPEMPIIYIYADETGKNDDYVIVGSLWILDEKRNGEIAFGLNKWLKKKKEAGNPIPEEFHFVDIKNNGNNLEIYANFFNYFMETASDVVSFTAIAVNKTKLTKSTDDLIAELFYQIVRIGIENEKKNNRISFPKQLSYLKDEEEGESKYKIKAIQDLIVDKLLIHYKDDVKLNRFNAVDSKHVTLIQVADLFTSSLNRVFNHQRKNPDAKRNAKDAFAEDLLKIIDVNRQIIDINQFENGKLNEEIRSDMSNLYIFD